MRQPELILLKVLSLLTFCYNIQLNTPLIASSRYISSINALGVSLSFMPIQIQMLQDTNATAQPSHCTSGSPPLSVNALTIYCQQETYPSPTIDLFVISDLHQFLRIVDISLALSSSHMGTRLLLCIIPMPSSLRSPEYVNCSLLLPVPTGILSPHLGWFGSGV